MHKNLHPCKFSKYFCAYVFVVFVAITDEPF